MALHYGMLSRARINDPARATAARGPFGENLRLALVGQRVSIGDVDMRGPKYLLVRGRHNIVSASQDGKIIIWNSKTTKLYLGPAHSSWVRTCAFEQQRNEMVACGGLNNLCYIYRTDHAQVMRAMSELAGHDAYLSCCRFVDECSILPT